VDGQDGEYGKRAYAVERPAILEAVGTPHGSEHTVVVASLRNAEK
jgi:hypothetical protein